MNKLTQFHKTLAKYNSYKSKLETLTEEIEESLAEDFNKGLEDMIARGYKFGKYCGKLCRVHQLSFYEDCFHIEYLCTDDGVLGEHRVTLVMCKGLKNLLKSLSEKYGFLVYLNKRLFELPARKELEDFE